jgi:hypothetical protein
MANSISLIGACTLMAPVTDSKAVEAMFKMSTCSTEVSGQWRRWLRAIGIVGRGNAVGGRRLGRVLGIRVS